MLNRKKLNKANTKLINGGGRPIFYGANGYLSRNSSGHYKYTVTKGSLESTLGVMSNGWAGTAGGGSWTPNSHGRH